MYAYTTTSAAGHTFSPECAWEEWHAALDENAPEGTDLNAQGVCCHTHQTIVVDTMEDAPEAAQVATTEYDEGLAAGLTAYYTAAWFERCDTRSKAYRAGYSTGWAEAYRTAHNLPAFN